MNQIKSKDQGIMVGFMPLKYYLLALAAILVGVATDHTLGGFFGGYGICLVFGMGLEKIGNHTPIVKTYLGGGAFLAILGGSLTVYFNLMPETTAALVSDFIKTMDYIGLVVGLSICGSILSMKRSLLMKAGALFFVPLVGGIFVAMGVTALIGAVSGYGWQEAIMYITLPIMGGGTAAGAVPMSEVYANALTQDSSYYLSQMMSAVVLGNACAIVCAGLMKAVGNKFPSVSGDGKLMKTGELNMDELKNTEADTKNFDIGAIGRAFMVTIFIYAISVLCGVMVPSVHYYAWLVIICAIIKIFNLFPEELEPDVSMVYSIVMKVCIPAVLFGIGIVYTSMQTIIESMSIIYLVLVLATLLGAVGGTWFLGKLVGFYPVEISITAGLCMANMGGSGDVATLGAADRMDLMPFAMIATRIGGTMIILLAGIIAPIIGVGL